VRANSEARRILIIDDERPILMTLEALLNRHGYQTETATTATLGLRAMKTNPAALVLLDFAIARRRWTGNTRAAQKDFGDSQVIILTAHDSLNNAIESIKRGAFHFISKPYAPEELLSPGGTGAGEAIAFARDARRCAKKPSNWRSGWSWRRRGSPRYSKAK